MRKKIFLCPTPPLDSRSTIYRFSKRVSQKIWEKEKLFVIVVLLLVYYIQCYKHIRRLGKEGGWWIIKQATKRRLRLLLLLLLFCFLFIISNVTNIFVYYIQCYKYIRRLSRKGRWLDHHHQASHVSSSSQTFTHTISTMRYIKITQQVSTTYTYTNNIYYYYVLKMSKQRIETI